MARGRSQVTLTFAGDHDKLEKSFAEVGSAAKDMAKDVERASDRMGRSASESFDRVGRGAGDLDTRAMGFRDSITGVQDSMEGWSALMKGDISTGLFTLGAGVGDLASSVENLIVPLVQAAAQHLKTTATWVAGHAKMMAATVASVARQVAAWALLGVQSLIHAAKVAAAWLISIGPLALVGAAIAALVILIIKNWDTVTAVTEAVWNFVKNVTLAAWDAIKNGITAAVDFIIGYYRTQFEIAKTIISAAWTVIKTVTSAAWEFVRSTIVEKVQAASKFIRKGTDFILALFRNLPRKIGNALAVVARAITAPFRRGFAGIRKAWNSTVGGRGFDVPSWVPGIGGKSFRIPKLAQGAIVTGPTLALLGEGAHHEAVLPLPHGFEGLMNQPTVIEIRSGGTALDDVIVELMRKAIRNRGGTVQAVLG